MAVPKRGTTRERLSGWRGYRTLGGDGREQGRTSPAEERAGAAVFVGGQGGFALGEAIDDRLLLVSRDALAGVPGSGPGGRGVNGLAVLEAGDVGDDGGVEPGAPLRDRQQHRKGQPPGAAASPGRGGRRSHCPRRTLPPVLRQV